MTDRADEIIEICKQQAEIAFPEIQKYIISFIESDQIKSECQGLTGETALLFCFHKEFNNLVQYEVNQRNFYQWIGQKNSLNLKVPCYSSGTMQLRAGKSKILVLTDGVIEVGGRPFEDDDRLRKVFRSNNLSVSTKTLLDEVQRKNGRDSVDLV